MHKIEIAWLEFTIVPVHDINKARRSVGCIGIDRDNVMIAQALESISYRLSSTEQLEHSHFQIGMFL